MVFKTHFNKYFFFFLSLSLFLLLLYFTMKRTVTVRTVEETTLGVKGSAVKTQADTDALQKLINIQPRNNFLTHFQNTNFVHVTMANI